MTAFGIIAKELGDSPEHYVGDDDVLWDWLLASDFEPVEGRGSWLRVKAPAGYVFHDGNLFPAEGFDGGRDSETVTVGFPQNDKALMVLVSLRSVTAKEFYALDIEEDRIMEILIY